MVVGKMDADGKMDVQDCYIQMMTDDILQMMTMFFGQLGFITVSSVESK